MRPATGGTEPEHRGERDWILRCEGFRVYGPAGELVGVVTGVVYDHSARWDTPHGLRVRRTERHEPTQVEAIVLLAAVTQVDVVHGSIIVDPRV